MINNFPHIYEDEMLYSLIARYRRQNGIFDKKYVGEDLIGVGAGIIPMKFPSKIDRLCSSLPKGAMIKAEELIRNNTVYPFYTAFFTEEKANEVLKSMRNDKKVNIGLKIGLGGGKVKGNRYLSYCPICVKEDIEMYGESYWRRIHQIEGVHYCDKHKGRLEKSKVIYGEGNIEYVCLDDIKISDEVRAIERYRELNLKYIENVKYILRKSTHLDIEEINTFYIDRLIKKGLASKNGNIYMNKLLEEFETFYTQEYLELMQSSYETVDKSNWLRLFIRKNTKNRSALRHLLLLQFLNVSPKELFENKESVEITKDIKVHTPILDLEERKRQWLNIIKDNPQLPRSELKKIGKGIHTYVFKYAKEWYHEVTPRVKRKKRKIIRNIEEEEKYIEQIESVIKRLSEREEKSVKITKNLILREAGLNRNRLNNERWKKINNKENKILKEF